MRNFAKLLLAFASLLLLTAILSMPIAAAPLDKREVLSECDLSGKDLFSDVISPSRIGKVRLVSDLDSRLSNCEVLRDNISWQVMKKSFYRERVRVPKIVKVSYVNWNSDQKYALAIKLQLLLNNKRLELKCPDIYRQDHFRRLFSNDNSSNNLFYAAEEAFDVFTAHVAHSLFLEAKEIFPWRLKDHHAEEIQEILSSDRYVSLIKPNDEFVEYPADILPGRDYQSLYDENGRGIGLCDPQDGYYFMQEEFLVGTTEQETLANIMDWMRRKVSHGVEFSSVDPSVKIEHVFLHDRLTVREWVNFGGDTWRALLLAYNGCHGAASDFRNLARSMNIPVLVGFSREDDQSYYNMNLWTTSHAGLCWKWKARDGRCVPHSDDFYAEGEAYPGATNTIPLDIDGNHLTESERKMRDFQTIWLAKGDLGKWGFVLDIHRVTHGIGFGVNESPKNAYDDLGYFLGYWLMSDRQAANVNLSVHPKNNPYGLDLQRHLLVKQVYELGTWTNFMEFFVCDGPQQPENNIYNELVFKAEEATRSGFLPPAIPDNLELGVRGWSLASSIGGCQAVQEEHGWWEMIKKPRFY